MKIRAEKKIRQQSRVAFCKLPVNQSVTPPTTLWCFERLQKNINQKRARIPSFFSAICFWTLFFYLFPYFHFSLIWHGNLSGKRFQNKKGLLRFRILLSTLIILIHVLFFNTHQTNPNSRLSILVTIMYFLLFQRDSYWETLKFDYHRVLFSSILGGWFDGNDQVEGFIGNFVEKIANKW